MKTMFKIILAMLLAWFWLSVDAGYAQAAKPNIVVIWGDDIGESNISAYSMGLMGYQTPNIDRIAKEGMIFTDMYADQSCTAGRSSFITGQSVVRTGLSKVGMPGALQGLQNADATIATLLKEEGYATGQFGKNHLGDPYEFATITSNTYWDWVIDHAWILYPMADVIGPFLKSFEEYPPVQKPGSFTVGHAFKALQAVPHQ